MLIDGRAIPHHGSLRADVVVVGAGPAGITVAEELAGAGRHVLLLESAGREHGRDDDDALDGDGSGEPFPLQRSRHRGFGGTSTHWTPATGLRVRPLDEVDLRARPCRPNDGWPFGLAELTADYERAYRSIGLEEGNEASRWFGAGSPTSLAWPGGPQLAMFQFAPHDSFTSRFDRVHGADLIDVALYSTVARLDVGADGESVRRASVVTPTGGRFFVNADVFVLACGGIDNARVLLNSPTRGGRPIGHQHDNVGRYFMDHLSVDTGIIVPEGTSEVAASIFREQRTSGEDRFQPMLWLGNEIIDREGIANAAFWVEEIDPLYRSRGVGAARLLRAAMTNRPQRKRATHAAGAIMGAPGLFAYGARRLARFGSTVIAMRIMTEQVPNRDSQIRLSNRRDALGIPRVDVDWRITGADLDVIVAHQELLARLLAEHGVAALKDRFNRDTHPSPIMSNYHHLGTTRMHPDPRYGVVDADGRVHSTSNVYVVGSSVFPTGGYVNPTLTILALAFRTARAIARRWRSIAVTDESKPAPAGSPSGVAELP
jgi:choline dehydrogenase-like flavoprotein